MIRKIKYIPQLMQTECGLCCIAMIAEYYNHHVTLSELRDFQQPGRDGVSARHLCKILDWIQFDYDLYKCGWSGLVTLKLPLIAHWKKAHFVVVEKITPKNVHVVDPSLGRVIYSKDEFLDEFGGIVICPHPKPDIKRKKREKSIWLKYVPMVISNKGAVAGVILFSILSYIASLVIPILVEKIMAATGSDTVRLICIGFLAVFGYTFAFLMNALLGVILKTGVYKDFYKSVFKRLTNAEYSYFENRATGGITFSLECISTINDFYAEKLITVVVSIGAFIVLSVYIALKSLTIFIALAALLILLSATLYLANKRVVRLSQTEINSKAKMSVMETEFISAIGSIKIGGLEDEFYNNWDRDFTQMIAKTKKRGIAQAVYSTISSALLVVLPIIVLFIGLYSASRGTLAMGSAISLYSISAIVVTYAVDIFNSANRLDVTKNYLDRIKDIIIQPEEKNGDRELSEINEIAFKNVSFKYNLHAPLVLENIDMRFEKGKKIAIVGGSGSGKSTIAKLIIKLYAPTDGEILYDGISGAEVEKNALKKLVGMVPQDGTLFNKSVLENITLFRKNYTMDEVCDVCRAMQIYDDIMDMPMKFETLLSDIGSNVSGGQKQRLILARALMSKSQFLVLDEATSSLDAVTEQAIFDELRRLNCTQIIIAHRLSTVADSDYIYVLKEGKVVEQGKHEELIAVHGTYYELYRSSQRTNG